MNVKCDLLFSWDVALSYRGAVHFGHLHVVLDLSELQTQVLTANGHQCAAFSGATERCNLLGKKNVSLVKK